MRPSSDGGVDITRDGSMLARFAAPWAKDAGDRSLATSYSLKGHVLTQTIETAGAVFPVVADPRLETTASILGVPTRVKVWFSRSETEGFYRNRDYGVPVGAAAAALCAGVSGTILTGLCVAAIGYVTVDFTNNVTRAHNQNHCLTLEIGLPALVDWDHGDGRHCVHPS